jgi:hypothetical protein
METLLKKTPSPEKPEKPEKNDTALPELSAESASTSNVDRRTFLVRNAVIGAAAVMTGATWTPEARAAQAAKEASGAKLGSSPLSPDLNVVKKSKGPIMTVVDEFYKVGPGPSSSHTIGPMRITYDFYQRCTKLAADQLAKATGLKVHLFGSLSATGKGPYTALPSFCRVAASIAPAADSHIRFEVWSGAERVRDSVRLFMMPGVLHCAGGDGPDQIDHLAALEQWVEKGEAPARVLARRSLEGGGERTRPLSPHPQRAHYRGTGSTDDARSFDCVGE